MKEILQTPTFARKYKKLHPNVRGRLNAAIVEISKFPEIGEEKKGDLGQFRVFKFKNGVNQVLLAYRVISSTLELVDFGTHENFYRDLKKLIK
jgi:mRNA-degrading endonuclease RelE of RelBE toxin-antitoxin system